MKKASLVLLLGFALLSGTALAQNETTTNDSAVTNETPAGNETAVGNETDGGGAPAAPEPVNLVLTGHGEGGAFFFRIDGETARNPRITVAPGAEVTVTLRTVSGGVHNFCTDATGKKECTPIVSEGDEATFTFTAPDTPGSFEYWCDPHRGSGMRGALVVAAEAGNDAGSGDGGGSEDFSGPTVDLGDLGYPDCAGTLIPAASADQAVGGPTVSDYVDKCRRGDEPPPSRPSHPADYVIPGSFLLIGLGVLGVVWVARGYKP